MDHSWQLGLQTQREERRDVVLDVTDAFPEWLEGTFISNGPGQFEDGEVRYNGRAYRYAYLAPTDYGSLPTAIAKIDLAGPTPDRWSEPGLHPGESLFVPAPSPAAEDDGVLLSLALGSRTERSAILCLDAETLTELARAYLPHRLPYGSHSQFYGPVDPGRSMA